MPTEDENFLIQVLTDALERGRPPASILHELSQRGFKGVNLVRVARAIFRLGLDQMGVVNGWEAGGVSDEDVNRHVARMRFGTR